MEVEILVAEVGITADGDQLFHILYDGTVMDERSFTVLGGDAEAIAGAAARVVRRRPRPGAAVRIAAAGARRPRPHAHRRRPRGRRARADQRPALLPAGHRRRHRRLPRRCVHGAPVDADRPMRRRHRTHRRSTAPTPDRRPSMGRTSTSTATSARASARGPAGPTTSCSASSPRPTSPAGSTPATRRSCARRVRPAVANGVAIGAQVSYPDLAGFGRRFIDIAPAELTDAVLYQLGALDAFARVAGGRVALRQAARRAVQRDRPPRGAGRRRGRGVAAWDAVAAGARAARLGGARRRPRRRCAVRRRGLRRPRLRRRRHAAARGTPGALLTDPAAVADQALRAGRGSGVGSRLRPQRHARRRGARRRRARRARRRRRRRPGFTDRDSAVCRADGRGDRQSAARIVDVGRHAVLVELDSLDEASALAGRLRAAAPRGVDDVVGGAADGAGAWHRRSACAPSGSCLLGRGRSTDAGRRTRSRIPVVYDGEDLAEVADAVRLSVDEVVGLHAGADVHGRVLRVRSRLRLPHRSADRRCSCPAGRRRGTRVPAGSVAIAGELAAVYPTASPGGWHLLGRTDRHPVRRRPRPAGAARPRHRRPVRPAVTGRAMIEVVAVGIATTVQDRGRVGWAHLGVGRSGAADIAAHDAGQPAGRQRPRRGGAGDVRRRCGCGSTPPAVVAVTGAPADVAVDGGPPMGIGHAHALPAGATVSRRRRRAAGCVATSPCAAGSTSPAVLGSRSRDTLGADRSGRRGRRRTCRSARTRARRSPPTWRRRETQRAGRAPRTAARLVRRLVAVARSAVRGRRRHRSRRGPPRRAPSRCAAASPRSCRRRDWSAGRSRCRPTASRS